VHIDNNAWSQFIGLPYRAKGRTAAGCDCWGLVRLVLLELAAVELPSYADRYGLLDAAGRAELSALIRHESRVRIWQPVTFGHERALDLLSLSIVGDHAHVGVVVEPGSMLHIKVGQTSAIERYTSPAWRRRVNYIRRHAALV